MIEVLLHVAKDDCEETVQCKETTPENPQQICGNNNGDSASFLEREFDTGQHTGTLVDEAFDGE